MQTITSNAYLEPPSHCFFKLIKRIDFPIFQCILLSEYPQRISYIYGRASLSCHYLSNYWNKAIARNWWKFHKMLVEIVYLPDAAHEPNFKELCI